MDQPYFPDSAPEMTALADSSANSATRPASGSESATSESAPKPHSIIIDTDPGTDDAMAILYALNSPEVEVEAVTVVAGNVTAQQGMDNALKLVSLAGRCDLPVARGAEHPLNQKLITAEYWHGKNGLANIELPPSRCREDNRSAVDLIIELVHQHPNEITLVSLSPETNIAMAVSKDPSIVPLVREVVVMGGSLSGGNSTAVAEANIYGDPEAARIVFNAGWHLTMVGLEMGNRALLTRRHIAELARTNGPQNDFVVEILNFLEKLGADHGFEGIGMYDPLAVGVAINPGFVTTSPMRVDIETRGEFTRGETVANRSNILEQHTPHDGHLWIEALDQVKPNANVAVDVKSDEFIQTFIKHIAGK